MAHLVESMAYVGQTPWHGLGQELSENQPIEVWEKEAGMDWRIEKAPVRFVAGATSYLGEIRAYEERQVLYRSDNFMPLSVVSDRYHVVQPREILEFYRDLSERSGFELETAGVLKSGKKLWALAKTGQSGTLKGDDVTRGYLLLATACDGTMATTAQFTSVRVVCNNTLAVALNNASSQVVKVPHNTAFNADAVKQELGITVSAWDDFIYDLKHLSNRKLKDKEAQSFIERVFNPNPIEGKPLVNQPGMEKVLSLYQGNGMGSRLASANGTAYGALSAFTEFVDHHRRSKSADHRLDSAWFGIGSELKLRALREARLLAA